MNRILGQRVNSAICADDILPEGQAVVVRIPTGNRTSTNPPAIPFPASNPTQRRIGPMVRQRTPAVALSGHVDQRSRGGSLTMVAVRFDPEMFKDIREIAVDEDVSFAEQVRRLVSKGMQAA